MTISQLMNNSRQEWMLRVGCLFMVVGVHLWLLLFNPFDIHLAGKAIFSDQSIKNMDSSSANTLFISFSKPSQKKSHKIEKIKAKAGVKATIKRLDKKSSVIKKVINKKMSQPIVNSIAVRDKVSKVQTLNKPDEKSVHKIVVAIDTKRLAKEDTVSVTEMTLNTSKSKKELKKEVKKVEDIVVKKEELVDMPYASQEKISQYSKIIMVYKPQLIAPPIPPLYPTIARRKKQQGTVWLDVLLDKKGKQKLLYIHKSSGVPVLDKAAIKAVKQWKFAQFQRSYHAQQVKIRIPIEFLLN